MSNHPKEKNRTTPQTQGWRPRARPPRNSRTQIPFTMIPESNNHTHRLSSSKVEKQPPMPIGIRKYFVPFVYFVVVNKFHVFHDQTGWARM